MCYLDMISLNSLNIPVLQVQLFPFYESGNEGTERLLAQSRGACEMGGCTLGRSESYSGSSFKLCPLGQGNTKNPNFTDNPAPSRAPLALQSPPLPGVEPGPVRVRGRAVAFLITASVTGPLCPSVSLCLSFSVSSSRLGSKHLKLD